MSKHLVPVTVNGERRYLPPVEARRLPREARGYEAPIPQEPIVRWEIEHPDGQVELIAARADFAEKYAARDGSTVRRAPDVVSA